MENVRDALDFGHRKLGCSQLREGQRKVVKAYLSGRDVFFRSPTRSSKSLCFEVAPFVFEGITGSRERRKTNKYILPFPCGNPSRVFDEKPSRRFEKLRYNSSNFQPRKYCRGTERHPTRPI